MTKTELLPKPFQKLDHQAEAGAGGAFGAVRFIPRGPSRAGNVQMNPRIVHKIFQKIGGMDRVAVTESGLIAQIRKLAFDKRFIIFI